MKPKSNFTSVGHFSDRNMAVMIGIFVILAVILGGLFYYSHKISNATRAYTVGEGHWSKAQKNAVIDLLDYLRTQTPEEYQRFKTHLQVIEGNRAARQTLSAENPDYEKAHRGFIKGNNDPAVITDMIWFFDNFQHFEYMSRAIDIWKEGDQGIEQLQKLGQRIKSDIESGSLTPRKKDYYTDQIQQLDEHLTILETAFSSQIETSARNINELMFWAAMILCIGLIIIAGYVSVIIISRFKELGQKLNESRSELQHVLENSRDIVYKQNLDTDQYEYISSAVQHMLGYEVEEIIQKGPPFVYNLVHPEDKKRVMKKVEKIQKGQSENGSILDTEYRIQTSEGKYIWVNNYRSLLYDNKGEPSHVVGNVRNISKRKQKEQRLNQSLNDKQLLLSEIHHRVKNNLAIVSGILMLQSQVNDDDYIRNIFQECQNRIDSIAEIHDLLYQTEQFSEINLQTYLRNLLNRIVETSPTDLEVDYELSIEVEQMRLSKAVHFGLLINELVTNSIKHAFPDKSKGKIFLSMENRGGRIHVTYRDDGIGIQKDGSEPASKEEGIGMQLVETFLKQLEANYQFKSPQKGFNLDFTF